MTPRRWVVAAAAAPATAALAAALAVGGVAWGMWHASAPFAGGSVASGDLRLTAQAPVWNRVVPEEGLVPLTPGDVTMPGDVIRVTLPVTTYLRGDNLAAALTLRASDVVPGVPTEVTYHVEAPGGALAGPSDGEAALGEPVAVEGLAGSDGGTEARWVVVVDVRVLGEYTWAPDDEPTRGAWDVRGLRVTLDQVREGPGFVTREGGTP
ncbi:hypothetical protein ET495_10390 [Xylanimonas allomyrinae]|uniref:Alternate-type signal peptide domain-containing protein n=1 Tax=Xylanimonas allomyrinae TaxID=2509459 RepID=A0A4P6EQA8_9MICO|nr:hypothetical protein [Xylanimonas allomyrinae]QAY63589.1 hypothetical protein ET495_10390 [Xylanimonas allomyrinae]